MEVYVIIGILIVHYMADFILQSDWMAVNKSRNTGTGATALALHGTIYATCFALFFSLSYGAFNGLLHVLVDYATSRICTHLWLKGERHWFFTIIGLDQLIHYACLIYSYGQI
jgi:hypothetical protein